jgi:hypothetical protein
VGQRFRLKTAHSAENARDCHPLGLTLPAPIDGPSSAQNTPRASMRRPSKDRPAMRLSRCFLPIVPRQACSASGILGASL